GRGEPLAPLELPMRESPGVEGEAAGSPRAPHAGVTPGSRGPLAPSSSPRGQLSLSVWQTVGNGVFVATKFGRRSDGATQRGGWRRTSCGAIDVPSSENAVRA